MFYPKYLFKHVLQIGSRGDKPSVLLGVLKGNVVYREAIFSKHLRTETISKHQMAIHPLIFIIFGKDSKWKQFFIVGLLMLTTVMFSFSKVSYDCKSCKRIYYYVSKNNSRISYCRDLKIIPLQFIRDQSLKHFFVPKESQVMLLKQFKIPQNTRRSNQVAII